MESGERAVKTSNAIEKIIYSISILKKVPMKIEIIQIDLAGVTQGLQDAILSFFSGSFCLKHMNLKLFLKKFRGPQNRATRTCCSSL